MRAATYYVAVSLDGFIADPSGGWSDFAAEGDHMAVLADEFRDTLPAHIQELTGLRANGNLFDTVLMGWRTYTPALDEGIDSPYPHLRQYVASRADRSLPEDVEQTSDPLATLQALKAEEDGSGIYVAGGGALAGAVISELDRLILKVNPVVLGSGVPLFADTSYDAKQFRLDRSRSFDSGVVINEYSRGAR